MNDDCTCHPIAVEGDVLHHRDCPVDEDLASRQRLADYLAGRLTLGEFCGEEL